jgi:hypothetical protein
MADSVDTWELEMSRSDWSELVSALYSHRLQLTARGTWTAMHEDWLRRMEEELEVDASAREAAIRLL